MYKRFRLQIEKVREDEEADERAKKQQQLRRRREQRLNAKRDKDLDMLESGKYGS